MSPDSSYSSTAHITNQTAFHPGINAWRIFLQDQGNSPHTVKAFTADLLLFSSYLPADRPLGDTTTTDINNFLHWMQNVRGVPCSPKTLSRRITAIKAFFRWLHEHGVIIVNPAEKVLQISVISPLPQVLTPEEVHACLEVANRSRNAVKADPRPSVLLTLLLETGIKKTECLALSPNHIDLDAAGGPILFVRYASSQYRYKERKVALSAAWVDIYHEYKSRYPIQERVFPWSPRRLEYILEDIGKEAGLEKHLSFDMCRWTCALSDWLSDMDPNKIRQKLGVSKIQWRELRMKLIQLADLAEKKQM